VASPDIMMSKASRDSSTDSRSPAATRAISGLKSGLGGFGMSVIAGKETDGGDASSSGAVMGGWRGKAGFSRGMGLSADSRVSSRPAPGPMSDRSPAGHEVVGRFQIALARLVTFETSGRCRLGRHD